MTFPQLATLLLGPFGSMADADEVDLDHPDVTEVTPGVFTPDPRYRSPSPPTTVAGGGIT